MWDVVFGTLHMPARLPSRYGTDDAVPHSYLKQMVYPFLHYGALRQEEPPGKSTGGVTRQ